MSKKTEVVGRQLDALVSVQYDDKGYFCICGNRHDHPVYVYAHWDFNITHTCECGLKYDIENGAVEAH